MKKRGGKTSPGEVRASPNGDETARDSNNSARHETAESAAFDLLAREVNALSEKYAALDEMVLIKIEELRRTIQPLLEQHTPETAPTVGLRENLSAVLARQRILGVAVELHRAKTEALENSLREEIERGRHLFDKLNKEIATARSEGERHKRAAAAAQREIDCIRSSLTFDLGRAMAAGATSVAGFRALPGRLWNIYSRHRARKKTGPEKIPAPIRPDPEAVKREAARRKERLKKIRAKWEEKHGRDGAITAAELKALRVAGIMDTFTLRSFEPECQLFQLTPEGCARELKSFSPDMILLESAWRGKNDLWTNDVRTSNPAVMNIIAWSKKNSVPVAFWNKEDPVHFDWFIDLARECDFVFTTDLNCVADYKRLLLHDDVYVLPFAAQPRMHNPLEKYERKDAVSFAGSYYVKFQERCRDLEELLDAAAEVKPVVIFDRQRENVHPDYQFPDRFGRFIAGSLPYEEIDRAYKEYKYAVNINTVKTSPSMFARRAFELLACNTIVLSNHSHGLKTMLGDLTIASDDGRTVMRQLSELDGDPLRAAKFRLAGLRAVMSEHTYQDRFSYVVKTIFGLRGPTFLPRVAVVAKADTADEARRIVDNFRRQSHRDKKLFLVRDECARFEGEEKTGDAVFLTTAEAADLMSRLKEAGDWLALLSARDYYGPNYLLDLALAARYGDAPVLGKNSHFRIRGDTVPEQTDGAAYIAVEALPARRAIAKMTELGDDQLDAWIRNGGDPIYTHAAGLALDPFNYCEDALISGVLPTAVPAVVDDIAMISGCGADRLACQANAFQVDHESAANSVRYSPRQLFSTLDPARRPQGITVEQTEESAILDLNLLSGHAYWYSNSWLNERQVGLMPSDQARRLTLNMSISPGKCVSPVIRFADTNRRELATVVHKPNSNSSISVPPEAKWFQIFLRGFGHGRETIADLIMKQFDAAGDTAVGFGDYLLLTNVYPSRENLYRHMFVHARVKEYRKAGLNIDVFRLSSGVNRAAVHEFEGVECMTGDECALEAVLKRGTYKKIIVHFMTPAMWKVLRRHCDEIPVIVWLHGGEILPYHRREFDYTTEEAKTHALAASKRRVAFWNSVLNPMPGNLTLVFVSRRFADDVQADYGISLPDDRYRIIHNPIDTDLFAYAPKPSEQRKRIISIRPFATRKYGNDLTVNAILSLRNEPFFDDLQFLIVGDGILFEKTVAPLAGLGNVRVERGFLSMPEMADLYREYGVALIPTRHDTHGVSRDEAMAAGLVPITSRVAAIPEFVDESCAFLAEPENYTQLADAIRRLYHSPELFVTMSEAAHRRVLAQTDKRLILAKEIGLIANED